MGLINALRARLEVEKTRASIPQQRYELNQQLNGEQRHLQRAKEWAGKNQQLEQFHLTAAEELRAMEQKHALEEAGLLTLQTELQRAADTAMAEKQEALFQAAMDRGYPAWLSAWRLLKTLPKFIGRWLTFILRIPLNMFRFVLNIFWEIHPTKFWLSGVVILLIGSIAWVVVSDLSNQMAFVCFSMHWGVSICGGGSLEHGQLV